MSSAKCRPFGLGQNHVCERSDGDAKLNCHFLQNSTKCNSSNVIKRKFIREIIDIIHYTDVIMSTMAFQIIGVSIVYSIVRSGADQRKHQSSTSLAFVRGSSPVTGEFPAQRASHAEHFPFDDVIMLRQNEKLIGVFISVCIVNLNTHNSLRPDDAYICASKLNIIDSDNGLSPVRRQAITWTNARISMIWPSGIYFSEIWLKIQYSSFKKMHLKTSSAEWRSFGLGLNVLILWDVGNLYLRVNQFM